MQKEKKGLRIFYDEVDAGEQYNSTGDALDILERFIF